MRKAAITFVAATCFNIAFGRNESWANPAEPAPPVETLTNSARYIEWKWRADVTNPSTGLDTPALHKAVEGLVADLEPKEHWRIVKARAYELMCDKVAIGVSDLDWYPAFACWNRYKLPVKWAVIRRMRKIDEEFHPEASRRMREGNEAGDWLLWKDFDHSVPQWDQVLEMGLSGLRLRLRNCRCADNAPFYDSLEIAADASLRLIDRLAVEADRVVANGGGLRARRQAEAFRSLRNGAPKTTYEAMQMIYLYWVMCEHLDAMQCRSLTVIDQTLWPYYRADLAAGRTTETEFREQFLHFLWQWGSIDNNMGQPITLGGTNLDGTTACNPLTRIILEVYDEFAQPTPKMHLKVHPSTPSEILDQALDMARRQRPLSFCGEEQMWAAMMSYGITKEDAVRCITKGCYEFCPPDGANATDMGEVSYIKPVERLLDEAAKGIFTAATYVDFEREYMLRLRRIFTELLEVVTAMEQHLEDVNPSNMGTLGTENSVRTGRDAFANGAKKGNNTGIETTGFGTAVDALMAVKEIVYENREMSLPDLGRLMAANWKGRDDLRLRMLRSKRKWGTNDCEANALGKRISKAAAETVNYKPNARGGQYLLSGHSARAFIWVGDKTGATPDGRRRGEEMSKNLSAAIGADSEGVTALINTLGSISSLDFPYDFPLDVMMLPSTAEGKKGLEVMKTALEVYYANGGIMLQFNVVSPELLREAQTHPERFANLQVRVCGWSVRWNDMPKFEQDAYIRRAEGLMQ